jgi:Tfp pilus assembly protein PilO
MVVRQDDFEAVVIEALYNRAKEVSQTLETPEEEPVALKELKQQLKQLQQIPNPNSAITSAIADLQAQIHQLKTQSGLQVDQAESKRSSLKETLSDPGFWNTCSNS